MLLRATNPARSDEAEAYLRQVNNFIGMSFPRLRAALLPRHPFFIIGTGEIAGPYPNPIVDSVGELEGR
jgi:hypothetical protein